MVKLSGVCEVAFLIFIVFPTMSFQIRSATAGSMCVCVRVCVRVSGMCVGVHGSMDGSWHTDNEPGTIEFKERRGRI